MDKKWGKNGVAILMSPLPLHNNAGDVLLNKLLSVIYSESRNIYVIGGNVSSIEDKDVEVIKNVAYDTRNNGIISTAIKYFLMQIKYSLSIIRNRNRINLVFFWISSSLAVPMVTAKILGKKTFIMATGNVSNTPQWFKIFEMLNYYLADSIGVESKSVIKHMNIIKYHEKIIPFHLYVDKNFKLIKDYDRRENIVGYIGRLSKEKGILEFLDSIELLLKSDSDLKIFIGGSGPLIDSVKRRVKNLSDNVEFVDWIPHSHLVNPLNNLKLLVLPSYSEGLPNIMIEAMACGTPVLATPVGGIPDVIIDGETGFILEDNSPNNIADNVIKALNSPNLEMISKNGIKFVENEYTLERAAKICDKAIKKLM